MQPQDVAPSAHRRPSGPRPTDRAAHSATVDVEQAEAALVEHYPRLVRLAYLILPPSSGRGRRVLTAHALAQRALPRSRQVTAEGLLPGQRDARSGPGDSAGYAYVRLRVLRAALEANEPLSPRTRPRRAQFPAPLPRVWGLRLAPRAGGPDELALHEELSALSAAARAAFVLRGLDRLDESQTAELLASAGVSDPRAALTEAAGVRVPGGVHAAALLASPEFDPCSLQARPTDLLRRRQHVRAALLGAAALAVCGALLVSWTVGGSEAPAYSAAQRAALDPGRLTTAPVTAWRSSARQDFSVWPARGGLLGDRALLGRALATWAAPGGSVRVSATPGTQTGGPAGPPKLLFAGRTPRARVVLMYDGLRIARYAEPAGQNEGAAALDLVRVDGADAGTSAALVVERTDGNVRYLVAPWVRGVANRDLRVPGRAPRKLELAQDGTTGPFHAPASQGECASWNALETTDRDGTRRLYTDLGELTPAHLTAGVPAAPKEVASDSARAAWAPSACALGAARAQGVRSVNSWEYARQILPEAAGTARWTCTRLDTWRGPGSHSLAGFLAPGGASAAVVAQAEDAAACGTRAPEVLAGALWKSPAGSWFLLAAGSAGVESIATSGDLEGSSPTRLLALPAHQGDQARLTGELGGGGKISALG
ncbi:hypothetical protein [Streptomyces sp. NPDC007088]|uniref:hypothetical protein n=1 Tax=Streptomyces sp. NPDC007088 TaxID=3364773 RepID=UPI0036A98C08